MPVLCFGKSSVQVDNTAIKPLEKSEQSEEDENNNEGKNRDGEVATDPEYAQATPGQSDGQPNSLVKSSTHKMKYEVNPDTTATSTGNNSSFRTSKRGRKLPKKKGSLHATGDLEEDNTSEKVSERSTPPKKKHSKKSSFRETDEMEMSPLDPGFFNTATLQATRQLYAQQTFEEEDDDVLENMEDERRKNKHRQRLKKKQGSNAVAAQPPPVDATQAAYERAQQEIDKVLGPRQASSTGAVPGVIVGDADKRRSKHRNKKGQVNEAFRDDKDEPGPSGLSAAVQSSDSLEEVRTRVHALLDDAFSLISNSYSSIGSAVAERSRSFKRNKVAPSTPSKKERAEEAPVKPGAEPPLAKSPPPGGMPEVEETLDRGLTPKPGEKLHTPIHVDRTYEDYDADGLITWSPYRAADESARIVLPQTQVPDSKAPVQEKLQTTTFVESAANRNSQPSNYYATQPGQPIIIRTRQTPVQAQPSAQPSSEHHSNGNGDVGTHTGSGQLGGLGGDTETLYTPYPGLESYQDVLGETTTTTAHFTAAPTLSSGDSAPDGHPPANGDDPSPDPPTHQPPSRNIGSKDERDFIASSLAVGTSPKELVDSIRQELKSMSGRMGEGKDANGHGTKPMGNGEPAVKPLKKPRKSSYLDS